MSEGDVPRRRSWRDADTDQQPVVPERRSLIHSGEQPLTDPQATQVFDGVPVPPTGEGGYGPSAEAGYDVPGYSEPGDEAAAYETAGYAEAGYAWQGGDHGGEDKARDGGPWWRNRWVIIGAAAAGVIAIVTTVVVLTSGGGGDVVASPSPEPSTSPSPTVSPTASPAPETLLDDGIADDEYPAAAASVGAGYPDALVMEDWVWDKVGEGWTLVSFVDKDDSYMPSGPSAIYLGSPEGRLFLLGTLPQSLGAATVESWIEGDHTARVLFVDYDYPTGALVNLDTMAVDQMSFTVAGTPSENEVPVAADAANNEVWIASDGYYAAAKIALWSPGSGWRDSGLGKDVGFSNYGVAPDDSVVAFEYVPNTWSGYAGPNSGDEGRPNLVLLDTATGAKTTIKPNYGAIDSYCYVATVTDAHEPVLRCDDYAWGSADATEFYTVATNGSLTRIDPARLPLQSALGELGEWVDPATGLKVVLLPSDFTAVRVETTGQNPKVLLNAGQELPYKGFVSAHLTVAGDGLALFAGVQGCAIIDAENGVANVLGATDGTGTYGCIPYGHATGTY